MKVVTCVVVMCAFCMLVSGAVAQEEEKEVYEDGTVWMISMIKTEANMQEEYIKDLAAAWAKVSDVAVTEGLILSYKVFYGGSANPDDWDVLLMTEFENLAAMEGTDDQWEGIVEQVLGDDTQVMEANTKRGKIREIYGGKLLREITFNF